MKFSCSIEINKPREKVIDAFLDPESMRQSQDGFIDKELISGKPHEVGAKSRLIYNKFEMTETITGNDLPDRFAGLYEHKNMTNTMVSTFEDLSNNKTRFSAEIEYIQFKGFVIKTIAKVFPGMFKKQGDKWLKRFKVYVENL